MFYDPDGDGPLGVVLIIDLLSSGLESSFVELNGLKYNTPEEKNAVANRMIEIGLISDVGRNDYDQNNPAT